MKTRFLGVLVGLGLCVSLAHADDCVPCFTLKPVTVYERPQPEPLKCAPPGTIPSVTLFCRVPTPPIEGKPGITHPVTLFCGAAAPVKILYGTPPPVRLFRQGPTPPLAGVLPPPQSVTIFCKTPECPKEGAPGMIPGVTVFGKSQPPCQPCVPCCPAMGAH